jgi:hypothetical protein
MATFLERATGHENGSTELLDLGLFELLLQLYISDVAPSSVFERSELGLTVPQLQELTDLLALMPGSVDLRIAWRARVIGIFQGARIYLEQLDTLAKVSAALGL